MVCDVCCEAWEFCDEAAESRSEHLRCQGYLERRRSEARARHARDRARALEGVEAAARAFRRAVDRHVLDVAKDGEAEYAEAGAKLDAALEAIEALS